MSMQADILVISAKDRLQRTQIRAPRAGIVHDLKNTTIGGVVAPGEPLMYIVPKGPRFFVEARISPADIDQVHIGQKAVLRFVAFNQRITPQLEGEVVFRSADQSREQGGTGGQAACQNHSFTVRIKIPDTQLRRLGHRKISVGMPVEVMIRTSERTVMSYLLKPLRDNFYKAFRER